MTETMIHGPFQAAETEDVFVLLAPAGAAQERTLQMAGMIEEIGAPYFVVSDTPSLPAQGKGGVGVVPIPPVPEPFTTLTTLIPMQLLAYHLALAHRRNPDIFRADDERFVRAGNRIKL